MLGNNTKLSIVIPAKTRDSYELMRLLFCIQKQDFPKDSIEVLVITEGTSESAKAIGIKKAMGEVIGIMASDNSFDDPNFLKAMYEDAMLNGAAFPLFYTVSSSMIAMDRYFALFGGNDPLSFYMGKNDRAPYFPTDLAKKSIKARALGDNGFFVKRALIEKTDLENYFHVDNANEIDCVPMPNMQHFFHLTGEGILSFMRKRYRYGLQHAFNPKMRWHLVDFRKREDILKLLWFILVSLTFVEPFLLSLNGFLRMKPKDLAWFYHPVMSFLTTITYSILMSHLALRWLYRSLSARINARVA